jgi:hypothetical protein
VAGVNLVLCLFVLAVCGRATTLATVGDSFADSFYFGLRARPELLKKSGIELIRWSRPSVGLARSDQFDYVGWLQDTADLGTADYCVVELGTNDMQSIAVGAGKWLLFPTGAWQNAYTGRVQKVTETLRNKRCRHVIWVLQPGFEKSRFLAKNRDLINRLQLAGGGSGGIAVEVAAVASDYGRDGIHFNGPFALKLADAILRIMTAWRDRVPESCFACHTRISAEPQLAAADGALRIRAGEWLGATQVQVGEGIAKSVVPPRVVAGKSPQRAARKVPVRRRRHHA